MDRIQHPPEGLLGGGYGAAGEFLIDGEAQAEPKRLLALQPGSRVGFNPPGGGGYGDPLARDPQAVLKDVVEGYVSVESARRDYGVEVTYSGEPDQLVRLPHHYQLEVEATELLRREMAAAS